MFDGVIFAMCKNCQAKNRLQVRHLMASPSCGKCHAPLLESEMAINDDATTLVPHALAEGGTVARGDLP
jgi:hypothetical protein